MSANPRVVLSDVTVTWGGQQTFVHRGTLVDIPHGSALEAAYGGAGNLADVTAGQREAAAEGHGALAN